MVIGYVQDCSKYFDIETQNEYLANYAKERQLKDFKIINIAENENILSQRMKPGDTVVIPNISLLGNTLEHIISSVKHIAERRVYIYSIKENLAIDTYNHLTLADCMDACLSAYKGIMSLRNSKIQQDLLEQGKPRGCPNNARKGKFILSGHEEEVRQYIKAGYSYAEIARKFGCNPGNVLYFVRYLGLKNPRTNSVMHIKHKLDSVKEEVIDCFNSGLPISQIAKRFGVCYATARDYVRLLGLSAANGGAHA
ncbi:MAG: hypothetical protein IKK52_04415 [Alphaproteobacteria bacterium]|nr:hypothetical protein [Alphaproteobacteria bacterium]